MGTSGEEVETVVNQTKGVKCQNCHAKMDPGEKTCSKVMEWTEYTCSKCGSIWSEGKPLPGHEPMPVIPKLAMEPAMPGGVLAGGTGPCDGGVNAAATGRTGSCEDEELEIGDDDG